MQPRQLGDSAKVAGPTTALPLGHYVGERRAEAARTVSRAHREPQPGAAELAVGPGVGLREGREDLRQALCGFKVAGFKVAGFQGSGFGVQGLFRSGDKRAESQGGGCLSAVAAAAAIIRLRASGCGVQRGSRRAWLPVTLVRRGYTGSATGYRAAVGLRIRQSHHQVARSRGVRMRTARLRSRRTV